MINISKLIKKYVDQGYEEIYANAKVAQDIILKYLFESRYSKNVTIKGGIVMYNLTNDLRRATIDIDIDLIRVYLADDNLYDIFTSHKMDGIDIIVDKLNIVDLRHQDYKGKRIPIIIKDKFDNEINTKIDVGVYTEYDIKQDELCFQTAIDDKNVVLYVNSKEQIFVEKIVPIIKFGIFSTRYKDFYDLYWLIKNGLDNNKIRQIMNDKIFNNQINNINDINKLRDLINNVLSNKNYISKLQDRKNNWLDISISELKDTIIEYLSILSNELVNIE